MPSLIYGTAWKKQRTSELVIKAFEAGFRGIDTACQPKHYEEALVGEALQQLQASGIKRDDYYLQTKFTPYSGHDPKRLPYDPEVEVTEQVKQSFLCSQQNLNTDYVDALILHSPMESFEQTLQAWHAMETIYEQGGALRLGISNCYQLSVLEALYDQATVKPSIVQNRFYVTTDYDTKIRQWCDKNNITYQSFWTLTANPHILEHETMVRIAMRHRASPAQILFRYLTDIGIVPLTGTTDNEHMQEDLACTTINLSDEESKKLKSLF
jgi:diketogulonate reductase-like aldo/keto reductase